MLFADLFQIARLIGRVVKAKRFNVQPKVINTFLALRIKEVTRREDEVKAKRKVKEERRKIMSRREKKVLVRLCRLECSCCCSCTKRLIADVR